MKSGKLNFLELSGPLQACNGTALSFIGLVQTNDPKPTSITQQGCKYVTCCLKFWDKYWLVLQYLSALYDKHASDILRNLVPITIYIKLDSQFEVCAHRNPHTRAQPINSLPSVKLFASIHIHHDLRFSHTHVLMQSGS